MTNDELIKGAMTNKRLAEMLKEAIRDCKHYRGVSSCKNCLRYGDGMGRWECAYCPWRVGTVVKGE